MYLSLTPIQFIMNVFFFIPNTIDPVMQILCTCIIDFSNDFNTLFSVNTLFFQKTNIFLHHLHFFSLIIRRMYAESGLVDGNLIFITFTMQNEEAGEKESITGIAERVFPLP